MYPLFARQQGHKCDEWKSKNSIFDGPNHRQRRKDTVCFGEGKTTRGSLF